MSPDTTNILLDDQPIFVDAMTGQDIGYPERLTLEMTSYCNLKCWMCPKTAGYVNTLPNHLIEEPVIKKVKELLPNIEILQLSGLWGEVFLHPETYFSILKSAKENGCEVRTISNGTLLTPEISKNLVGLGLDDLTISIDAASPRTYKDIRVGGDFKKLIKQLKKLKKIKKKEHSDTPIIHFAFVGMERNIKELPDLVKISAELGIQSIILQGMGEYQDTKGESLALHHKELGQKMYQKAREEGGKYGVDVSLFPPDQFEKESIDVSPVRGKVELDFYIPPNYRKDCDVPWKESVITTTGDVLICCSAMKPVGNILNNSFEEIWLSDNYMAFRKKLLSDAPPDMCKACSGVGWRKLTEIKDYLKMGETDGQLGLGWYLLEDNPVWGKKYRWSKARSTFFLSNKKESCQIKLTMRIAGLQKEGTVKINNEKVSAFSLSESKWENISFDLPKHLEGDVIKIEISVSNASTEGNDRRKLGIALSEAKIF